MEDVAYRAARDERAAVHLKAASVAIGFIFLVFVPYNLWLLPAPAHIVASVHDIVVCAVAAGSAVALHRGQLPHSQAHLLGLILALLVASNIALVQILTGEPRQLFYQALVLACVGIVASRAVWAVGTLAAIGTLGIGAYVMTWPIDQSFVHVSFAQFAVALMSLALVVGRGWYLDQITELSLRDRERGEQLRDALHTARDAERRLDAKVARRTSELRWANEALRQTIEERQRATTEKEALNHQLRHAQRIEAVGQLTGGIAHDFNNLITAVVGNVEMAMLDLPDDSKAQHNLRDAKRAAMRAGELTQQLLGFSRTDAPGSVVDVNDAFHGLAGVVGRLLGEDIRLRVHSCAEEMRVAMPPVQLDQVLLNLVVNARDAMPSGGTIDLRAFRDGNEVVVEVSDTGMGMDEVTRNRIFEAFFTTKPQQQGTGLGLSTVKSIITTHGGRIDVRSSPGSGTTFLLHLPLSELELTSRRSSIPPTRVPRGRGERILVVEDEDAVRRIAVRMLERLGYTAVDAGSGPEALRKLSGDRIDLLWTDVLMPGMDGRELADRVQAMQPEVPVLFASGYSGDVLAPKGVLPGHTNFLSKPYDAAEVALAVRKALDA